MTDQLGLPGRFYRMYPPGAFAGSASKDLALPVAETALVAVDVYGDGAGRPEVYSGMLADESSRNAAAIKDGCIAPVLAAASALRIPVVYVANSAPRVALAESAYAEQKWDAQHVDKDVVYREDVVDPREYHHGEPGALRYTDAMRPQPSDYYIRKHTHSGFFDTRLDTLLRNLRVRNLIFVGFALEVCLGATMMDALWRNYRVVLLRDCTHAIELPGIDEPGAWTSRWITYVESTIGYTATAEEFIEACRTDSGS